MEENLESELYMVHYNFLKGTLDKDKEDFNSYDISHELKRCIYDLSSLIELYEYKKELNVNMNSNELDWKYFKVYHKITEENKKIIEEFIQLKQTTENF